MTQSKDQNSHWKDDIRPKAADSSSSDAALQRICCRLDCKHHNTPDSVRWTGGGAEHEESSWVSAVRQHQIWPKENLQHLHSDHKVLYRRTNRLKGGPTWSYSNPEPSHCDAVITPCHPNTIIKRQRNKRKMKECKVTQTDIRGLKKRKQTRK